MIGETALRLVNFISRKECFSIYNGPEQLIRRANSTELFLLAFSEVPVAFELPYASFILASVQFELNAACSTAEIKV